MTTITDIIKEYIGKKENENDCAIFIKEILERIGIKINISTKEIKDKKSEIVLAELDKWGKRVDKPITGNVLGIITDNDTVHIGLFIDDYGRFYHIHNGIGVISKISPIINHKHCYIYSFKEKEVKKCLG